MQVGVAPDPAGRLGVLLQAPERLDRHRAGRCARDRRRPRRGRRHRRRAAEHRPEKRIPQRSPGHAARVWMSATARRSTARRDDDRAVIVAALEEAGGPLRFDEFARGRRRTQPRHQP
ncbi:hypothetical protein G5V59_00295 [Nocardioides sp. W3-2-3]|uniref:hypothetical protein n=1 Tax=Nocardioides convexus TaxID=2712224 RepID=UPI00241869D2|nr:hypothetical protein [Nocardioides convexus]NGZ99411.1 hypothetical protein [Nocardioides convexus]